MVQEKQYESVLSSGIDHNADISGFSACQRIPPFLFEVERLLPEDKLRRHPKLSEHADRQKSRNCLPQHPALWLRFYDSSEYSRTFGSAVRELPLQRPYRCQNVCLSADHDLQSRYGLYHLLLCAV